MLLAHMSSRLNKSARVASPGRHFKMDLELRLYVERFISDIERRLANRRDRLRYFRAQSLVAASRAEQELITELETVLIKAREIKT